MDHKLVGLGLLGLVALGSGCASLNAAQTANTMGQGGLQLGLEPAFSSWGGVGFPRVDLAVRYGITDRVDIGGKVGSSFAELNGKFQLTDPANENFVASIAPSVGGFEISSSSSSGSGSAGLINIAVPVLLGVKVGQESQLVIGPRLQDFLVNASSSSNGSSGTGLANVLGVGASVGFAAAVSDGFRIMPEVGVVLPVLGTASASSGGSSDSATGSLTGSGVVLWQVGLSFLFGQYHQHPPLTPQGPGAPPGAPPPAPSYPPPPPSYPPPPSGG